MFIDEEGYLAKRPSKNIHRNWFFIKDQGRIAVNNLHVGRKIEGKRVRLKIIVEVMDDE